MAEYSRIRTGLPVSVANAGCRLGCSATGVRPMWPREPHETGVSMRSRMRGVRRAGGLLLGSVLLVGLSGVSAQAAPAAAPSRAVASTTTGPSGVGAKSALLVDNATGAVKWSRAATTKRPIGSMTKTMTAVVVLRAGGVDKTLTVKQKYINY